jgi:hypothetical protein
MLKVGDFLRGHDGRGVSLGPSSSFLVTLQLLPLSDHIVRINSIVDCCCQRSARHSAWDIVESYRHVELLLHLILTICPIDWALPL